MKYIDADKLIAEIERLNSLVPYENNDRHDDGLHDAYKAVKNVIASLQQEQPEVELDREIIKYKVPFTDETECLNETTLDAIARHFWNKGYNAKKED